MEAVDLLIKFLQFAIPLIPGLRPVAAKFWGDQGLGPMPPDLAAWDDVDRRVDAQLKLGLEDTQPGDPRYSEPGDQ